MSVSAYEFSASRFHQKLEAHDHDEIIVCREGVGIIVIDGIEHHFGAGDVFLIPAGCMHEDIAPEPRRQCVIRLEGDSKGFLKMPQMIHDVNLYFTRFAGLLPARSEVDNPTMKGYYNALEKALIALIVRFNGEGGAPADNRALYYVQALDKQIRQNFANPDYDLVSAMKENGYTQRYFHQVFRNEIGRSPKQQLTHLRIEYAKTQMKLFKDTFSIKTYALNSGFHDPYYFSRVFKQLEGCSPREYIEKLSK